MKNIWNSRTQASLVTLLALYAAGLAAGILFANLTFPFRDGSADVLAAYLADRLKDGIVPSREYFLYLLERRSAGFLCFMLAGMTAAARPAILGGGRGWFSDRSRPKYGASAVRNPWDASAVGRRISAVLVLRTVYGIPVASGGSEGRKNLESARGTLENVSLGQLSVLSRPSGRNFSGSLWKSILFEMVFRMVLITRYGRHKITQTDILCFVRKPRKKAGKSGKIAFDFLAESAYNKSYIKFEG